MRENYIQLSKGDFYIGEQGSEDRYHQLAGVMFFAKGKPDTPGWRKLFKEQEGGMIVGDRTIPDEKDWTPMAHKDRRWIYPKWAIEIVDWYRKNDPETIKRLKKEFGEERVNQTPILDDLTVE